MYKLVEEKIKYKMLITFILIYFNGVYIEMEQALIYVDEDYSLYTYT